MAPKAREWRRQDQQVGGHTLERLSGNLLKTIDYNQQQRSNTNNNNHHHQQQQQQHLKSSKQVGNELNYHHKGSRNLLQSFKQDHHLRSLTANGLSLVIDRLAKLSPSSVDWHQECTGWSGIILSNLGDADSSPGGSDHHHHQQQQHHDHHHLQKQQRQYHHLKQVANWLDFKGDGQLGKRSRCALPFRTRQQAPVSSNPSRPTERVHLAKLSPLVLLLLPLLALSFVFTSASTEQSVSGAAVPSARSSSISAARPTVATGKFHNTGEQV